MEWTFNPTRNQLASSVLFLPLLYLCAQLTTPVIAVCRIHSWVRLLMTSHPHPQQPTHTFRIMESSLQEGSFRISTNPILRSCDPVCSVFSSRIFPLSCGGQPRAVTIIFVIWGSLWDTRDQPLEKRFPACGTELFHLATYGFWEEHCPLCRITPALLYAAVTNACILWFSNSTSENLFLQVYLSTNEMIMYPRFFTVDYQTAKVCYFVCLRQGLLCSQAWLQAHNPPALVR